MATAPRTAGATLTWPDHLAPRCRDLLTEVARRNRDRHGDARLLDGDPAALREAFATISDVGAAHDARRGDRRVQGVIAGWDEEGAIFGR